MQYERDEPEEGQVVDISQRGNDMAFRLAGTPQENGKRDFVVALVFVATVAAAVALFLKFALYVCVLCTGVMRPAWKTFKVLEDTTEEDSSSDADDDDTVYSPTAIFRKNWATYWVVVASLFTVEILIIRPTLGRALPATMYLLCVNSILLFLTRRNAENSRTFYVDFVRPVLQCLDPAVEETAKNSWINCKELGNMTIQYCDAVVRAVAVPVAQALRDARNSYTRGVYHVEHGRSRVTNGRTRRVRR